MGAGQSNATALAALPEWQQTVHVPYYGCSKTHSTQEGACIPEAYAHRFGVDILADPAAAFARACDDHVSGPMGDVVDTWDHDACAAYVAKQASLDYGTQKHTYAHASAPAPDAVPLLNALSVAAYEERQAQTPPVEHVEQNIWDAFPGVDAEQLAAQRGCMLTLLGGALPPKAPVYYEVGFNTGHSAGLVMGSFPGVAAAAFDTCEAHGTDANADTLKATFGDDKFDLVCGESATTIPARDADAPKFHAAFVDGSRLYLHARDDILNLHRFAAPNALLIVNKCTHNHVELAWNHSRASGLFTELPRHLCPNTDFCLAKYDATWEPQPDNYREDWYKPPAKPAEPLGEVAPDL